MNQNHLVREGDKLAVLVYVSIRGELTEVDQHDSQLIIGFRTMKTESNKKKVRVKSLPCCLACSKVVRRSSFQSLSGVSDLSIS